MAQGFTSSEKMVSFLCNQGFFKLWTHPNPIGKNGKELCDCLIVFKNIIIIISVKEYKYKETSDFEIGIKRWVKRCVANSKKQIFGAERWLKENDNFMRYDRRIVTLPSKKERKYYRIAVAMGGDRQFFNTEIGYSFKDDVFIFDGITTDIAFNHLDTISDFINFLDSVKTDLRKKKVIFDGGGIEDLLAIYLQNNYSFSSLEKANHIFIDDTCWKGFVNSENYKNFINKCNKSFYWDALIFRYIEDFLTSGITKIGTNEVETNDFFLVEMASYPRMIRVKLADALSDLRENGKLGQARFCIFKEYNPNKALVFLLGPSTQREKRNKDLIYRCLVILAKLDFVEQVMGIAIDPHNSKDGYSSELIYYSRKIFEDPIDEEFYKELKNSPIFKGIEKLF